MLAKIYKMFANFLAITLKLLLIFLKHLITQQALLNFSNYDFLCFSLKDKHCSLDTLLVTRQGIILDLNPIARQAYGIFLSQVICKYLHR